LQTDQTYQGVPLASLRTLAVLKCNAVANRRAKKDFVDLFALSQAGWSIEQMLEAVQEYAPKLQSAHVLQSLAYFDDAEHDPMPIMNVPVQWPDIKRYWQNAVVTYLKNHTAAPRDPASDPNNPG
jgi:hypothetical protein